MEYKTMDEWTFEQAMSETEKLPQAEMHKPNAPIFRWQAMRWLEAYEKEFKKQKNGFAVLAGVRVCAQADLIMPDWLARAFVARYNKVLNCHVGSWDDAFDRPYPKGVHLSALHKRRHKKIPAYIAVKKYLEENPEAAINKKLFNAIGKSLGLGGTLVGEYYYDDEVRKLVGEPVSKPGAELNQKVFKIRK